MTTAEEKPTDPAREQSGETVVGDAPELLAAMPPVNERPLVFISYRITPDQPLAVAVSRLISGSIEPEPHVFVSGAGGIRPSAKGYKPQLHEAVQRACAFVGVITHSSKEREWIFYEAGAAWGRNRLYAPLLIGTSPGDLASSIADFQAVHADRRAEVQSLIEELATACGGAIRRHFAQRYQAFERALTSYSEGGSDAEDDGEIPDPVVAAVEMALSGQSKAAKEKFAELERNASTPAERSRIQVAQVVSGKETGLDLLGRLEQLDVEHHASAHYLYWSSMIEPIARHAITKLKALLAHPDATASHRRVSTLLLAERQSQALEAGDSLDTLKHAMRSSDRELRARAALKWIELRGQDLPMTKVLVVLCGIASRRLESLFRVGATECENAGWKVLQLWFAKQRDELGSTGTTLNELGRAYASLDMFNLACGVYKQAADQGVAVSRANMASVIGGRPVAWAGLRILEEHAGPSDSRDPGFPHEIRAALEREVQQEREREAQLLASAQGQITLLTDFADRVVAAPPGDALVSRYMAGAHEVTVTGSADRLTVSAHGSLPELVGVRLGPLNGWELRSSACVGLLAPDGSGNLWGLHLGSLESATPAPSTQLRLLAQLLAPIGQASD